MRNVCLLALLAAANMLVADIPEASVRAALAGGAGIAQGCFRLERRGERHGCSFVPGRRGLFDGTLSFTDGTRTVSFTGFSACVAGEDVNGERVRFRSVATAVEGTAFVVRHEMELSGRDTPVTVCARFSEERGTLRLSMSCEDEVLISGLAAGPADVRLERVFAGAGYVIERPRSFTVRHLDHFVSRHVGADYANGISVVQAIDSEPERLVCDGGANLFALVPLGAACLAFVPSSFGAFAAARRLADTMERTRTASDASVRGKMCLVSSGSTLDNALGMQQAWAKKGRKDTVLLKGSASPASSGLVFVPEGREGCWVAQGMGADFAPVPWLDIVDHGFTVISGYRCTKDDFDKGRFRGLDADLCATVMGGRAPIGDLSLPMWHCIFTYDILHAVMRDFAHATFESLEFGPSVHQLHAIFSNGCEAWVNNSPDDFWQTPDWRLPPYGFYARSPGHEAGLVEWDTRRVKFSERKVFNP